MISKLFSFETTWVRSALSLFVVFHFVVLSASWFAQRGTSYFVDGILSSVADYTAIGNWRTDMTPMIIAGSTPLDEELKLEVHRAGTDDDLWDKPYSLATTGRRNTTTTNRWLMQLNGLLYYDNEDMVGRMVGSVLRAESAQGRASIDRIRISVAARPNQDQYEQIKNETAQTEVRNQLQSQVVYNAAVVDLGEGQVSLLPQLEQRRSSKSLMPSPNTARGAKP